MNNLVHNAGLHPFPKDLEGLVPPMIERKTVLSSEAEQPDLYQMFLAFQQRPEAGASIPSETAYRVQKILVTHNVRLLLNGDGSKVIGVDMEPKERAA